MKSKEDEMREVLEGILPYLVDCGYGGNNGTTERKHIRRIERALGIEKDAAAAWVRDREKAASV